MQARTLQASFLVSLVWLLAGCAPVQPAAVDSSAGNGQDDGATQATVLYSTGFEPDAFAPGALAGQGGWSQQVGNAGGAQISPRAPADGRYSLFIDGKSMAPLPGEPWGGVQTEFPLRDAIDSSNPTIVDIEADVCLDGPSTATGNGADDNRVSASLVVIGEDAGGLQGLAVSQLASSELLLTSGVSTAPVTLGEYHRLGLRLDFSQQTVEYFLDGASIGVEPFPATNGATRLTEVRLDLVGVPDMGQDYSALYDNLVIKTGGTTKPAP